MSDASVDRLTPQQIDQLADISGTILEPSSTATASATPAR
jgi:hypothetical protein